MVTALRVLILVLCVVAFAVPVCGQQIPNWPAPAIWTPAAERGSVHMMSAVTSALPFIGVTPCRLVDTRGTPGVPINTGGAFAANEVRTWTFTGLCGLPSSAAAVSLNITVTNTGASPFGFVKVWPGGGTEPNVSTLNWSAGGLTVANAGIVPLGTSPTGSVSLRSGNAGSDVLVDVNGYYGSLAASFTDVFLGSGAGNTTMTGTLNTAIGTDALASNTSGPGNTASGAFALFTNTTGGNNTAVGGSALFSNTAGGSNTASGSSALFHNTTGNLNTATGAQALLNNTTGNANTASGQGALLGNTTGSDNTASGASALLHNTTGEQNTASGFGALESNTIGHQNTADGFGALVSNIAGFQNTASGDAALSGNTSGHDNTASGVAALENNTTGSVNIAIGSFAGSVLTTGDNNIDIGNTGVAGESSTMRIGTGGTQTRTFLAGVRGVTTGVSDAVAVMVDSAGQLGTVSSSRRYKQDIEDMGEASQAVMKLRPVTFRYKASLDPTGSRQYGLIAEEVAEVFPDLAVYDKGGQAETVRYHVLVPMLLNEVQKDRKTIADLTARLERLEALMAESIR